MRVFSNNLLAIVMAGSLVLFLTRFVPSSMMPIDAPALARVMLAWWFSMLASFILSIYASRRGERWRSLDAAGRRASRLGMATIVTVICWPYPALGALVAFSDERDKIISLATEVLPPLVFHHIPPFYLVLYLSLLAFKKSPFFRSSNKLVEGRGQGAELHARLKKASVELTLFAVEDARSITPPFAKLSRKRLPSHALKN